MHLISEISNFLNVILNEITEDKKQEDSIIEAIKIEAIKSD